MNYPMNKTLLLRRSVTWKRSGVFSHHCHPVLHGWYTNTEIKPLVLEIPRNYQGISSVIAVALLCCSKGIGPKK